MKALLCLVDDDSNEVNIALFSRTPEVLLS